MKKAILFVAVVFVLLGLQINFGSFNSAGASAPSGLPTTVYAVTHPDVGPQQNILVFTSSDRCSSRVISTQSQGIMLNFATTSAQATSTAYLSGSIGHWQSASTTVAYDSGIYGCGALAVYGQVATTTITVSEFR